MQNLPVIAAPPVTPTQAPSQTDNNSTTQASEPFGNVLARQRANDAATASTGNSSTTQPPVPDAASNLPGDMLAALLPTTDDTNSSSTVTKDKTVPQAPVPNGVSTLPSDMLAILIPPASTTNSPAAKDKAPASDGGSTLPSEMLAMMLPTTATNGKSLNGSITAEGKKAPSQPIPSGSLDASRQSAKSNVVSSGVSGGSLASSANTSKDNAFSAALATLSKDGAKTDQLDTNVMKTQMQQVAPPAVDSLLQSGMASIAASQSGAAQAAQAVINTPVTNQAWGNEFNQKITWMATQHQQTAELHLNPPNLGPLDVVLKVSGDQATALFTSPHAAVRDAVEQALPQLRNMLADNGITLGNAMVSDQSPKDQQAWQTSQQQKGNASLSGTVDTTVVTGGISSIATTSRHLGMVDTFA